MKLFKTLIILATAASSIALSSCGCCTGEDPAPGLRPLPQFNALPHASAPAPTAVYYAK
ncbi:hypothetical protein OAI07_01950 [Akkermansiaceae bacterium]|nr:hypothetical protein [Akkermansiaceae bacterium]